MDYGNDEFDALIEAVENQGGAHLPDICDGDLLTFKVKDRVSKVRSCSCRNQTIFVTLYEPTDEAESKNAAARGGGFARTCAVCDDMGTWPRYAKAVAG